MAYRALKTFTGVLTMVKGEVREIKDETLVKDLLKNGFIVSLSEKKAEKKEPEAEVKAEEKPKAKSSKAKKAKGGESDV